MIRDAIWRFARRNHPAHSILTPGLVALRAVLYPIRMMQMRASGTSGYDPMTDTWDIFGTRYSTQSLHEMAKSDGALYRLKNVDGVVYLHRVRVSLETQPGKLA